MSRNAYCPYCGSNLQEGEKFCSNCGASMENSFNNSPTQQSNQVID